MIDEIHAFDPGFDIVVVDDRSPDGTVEVARKLGEAGAPDVVTCTLPFLATDPSAPAPS